MSEALESTATLVRELQQGNDDARERLFARCLPLLRRWAHGRLLPQGHGRRHRRSRGASRPPRPREVPQVVEEGSRALWRMVEAAGVVPLLRDQSSSRHSSRSRRRGARVSLR